MTKTCSSCDQEKPLSEFNLRGDDRTKRRSSCKECDILRRKRWLMSLPPDDPRAKRAMGLNRERLQKRERQRKALVEERVSVCQGIVRQLHAKGITGIDIERATGLDRRVVYKLLGDKPVKYVFKSTEDRLVQMLIQESRKR